MSELDMRAFAVEKQAEETLPVNPVAVEVEKTDTALDSLDEGLATTSKDAKESTAPGSLKRKWVEAMSYMSKQPVSYGALAGTVLAGVFGGSAAGAAASRIGMKTAELESKNYNAAQDRMLKLAQMDQNELLANQKAQATGANVQSPGTFSTKEGNPVVFEKSTGKFYTDYTNKKEIPAKEVVNINALESDRRQDRAEKNLERRDQTIALARDKFGFTKQESEDLSPAQFKAVSAAVEGVEQAKELFRLGSDKNTGIILGRVRNLQEIVDSANPEFTALKQKLGFALAGYQKAISGVAVSEQEALRLQKLMPKVTDSWRQFQIKAKGFESELERTVKTQLNLAKTTQGRGKGYIEEKKEYEALNKATPDKPAPLQPNERLSQLKLWLQAETAKPKDKRDPRYMTVIKKIKELEGK